MRLTLSILLVSALVASAAVRNVPADYATVQAAVTAAQPGDTVLVAAGTYNETVSSARHGTNSPIIFDGQGVATVKQFILSHTNLHLRNFAFAGLTTSTARYISMSTGASWCVISNNVIDANNAFATRGLWWDAPATTPFGTAGSYNTVVSNVFKNFAGNVVINFYGDTNLLYGNTMHGLDTEDPFNGFGRGNKIVANYIYNTTNTGLANHPDFFQTFGNNNYGCTGLLIESNVLINADSDFQLMMTSAFTTNAAHFGNWDIRNNLFIGTSLQASINIRDVRWYNNTFINCSTNGTGGAGAQVITFGTYTNETYGDVVNQSGHGGQFFNNLLVDCGGTNNYTGWYQFQTQLTNVAADYNFIIRNGAGVPTNALQQAIGDPGGWSVYSWWEPNGYNGIAPEIDSNFRPLPGSPIIGVGTNLNTFFTTDAIGTTRGDSWEVGAFEFISQPTPVGNGRWRMGRGLIRGKIR